MAKNLCSQQNLANIIDIEISRVLFTISEANSLAEITKTELSQVSRKHQWYYRGFFMHLYTGRLQIKQPAPQLNCQCNPVLEEQAQTT